VVINQCQCQLGLQNNRAGVDAAKAIARVLRAEKVVPHGEPLYYGSTQLIQTATCKRANHIKALYASYNRFKAEGVKAIVDAIKWQQRNSGPASGSYYIPVGCKYCKERGSRYYCYTGIRDCSIPEQCLEQCDCGCKVRNFMEEVYFDSNVLGDEGAIEAAQLLHDPDSKLRILSLRSNKISDEGAKQLLYGLQAQALLPSAVKLLALFLDWNDAIKDLTLVQIRSILEKNCCFYLTTILYNQYRDKYAFDSTVITPDACINPGRHEYQKASAPAFRNLDGTVDVGGCRNSWASARAKIEANKITAHYRHTSCQIAREGGLTQTGPGNVKWEWNDCNVEFKDELPHVRLNGGNAHTTYTCCDRVSWDRCAGDK